MYVVCLNCGAELEYDWELMRVGNRIGVVERPVQQHGLDGVVHMLLAPFLWAMRLVG